MRKLKLTLHPNQLKGLSASRHATWFRHIFSAKFTVILLYNYLTSIKRQNLGSVYFKTMQSFDFNKHILNQLPIAG